MIPHSIRARLLLWLALLLAGILTGFGITAYQLQRTNRLKQIDDELVKRTARLSDDVRGGPKINSSGREAEPGPPPNEKFGRGANQRNRPPGLPPGDGPPPDGPPDDADFEPGRRTLRLSPQVLALFAETEDKFYFAFWSRNGSLLGKSTNAPDVKMPAWENIGTDYRIRSRGPLREAYHFTEMGECALVGRDVSIDFAAMRRFAWWLVIAGGGVLALGLGGGGWFISRALQPVEEISDAAQRISAGNLSERINVAETDSELGQLAGTLNSTFARLEAAFAQQKQFTANASHELRTPIAVLISEAQTTLARERSVAEYREALNDCLDTAQQMRRLADSLLQLARFDSGQEKMQRTAFDLAEQVRICAGLVRPLATAREIKIQLELTSVEITADADRIGQVITNLLTNAIRYNKERGEIQVATRAENGFAILSVTDTGEGISSEDLPRVFERFYRADKSRSTAGTGLGLAICKAIVQAHGGTIEVTSQGGIGSTFTVRLPANGH